MSSVQLETPFVKFKGKICKHSQIIFKKVFDTNYTSQLCNPYKGPASSAQQAQRDKFKQARANALSLSEAENAAYLKEFKKQTVYKSFNGYKIAMEMRKLSVLLLTILIFVDYGRIYFA